MKAILILALIISVSISCYFAFENGSLQNDNEQLKSKVNLLEFKLSLDSTVYQKK